MALRLPVNVSCICCHIWDGQSRQNFPVVVLHARVLYLKAVSLFANIEDELVRVIT